MARYFFDLHDDVDALDSEGHDEADLEAAKERALAEARTMIAASVSETGKINLRHHIDVRDDTGAMVYTLRFEDAVTVTRGRRIVSGPFIDA